MGPGEPPSPRAGEEPPLEALSLPLMSSAPFIHRAGSHSPGAPAKIGCFPALWSPSGFWDPLVGQEEGEGKLGPQPPWGGAAEAELWAQASPHFLSPVP